MTIKNLKDLNIFDDNEQVVILNGNVNCPNKIYTGYFHNIPKDMLTLLEIELVSSMSESRRNAWQLNRYGWTEIWVQAKLF